MLRRGKLDLGLCLVSGCVPSTSTEGHIHATSIWAISRGPFVGAMWARERGGRGEGAWGAWALRCPSLPKNSLQAP